MAWDDDSWRDTYDEWKLRSPYDDYEDQPECECEEYEIDHEGRAECRHCGGHWWPSPKIVNAYRKNERRADRAFRRERSWYMRAWRWLRARLPSRREKFPVIDDDIPF